MGGRVVSTLLNVGIVGFGYAAATFHAPLIAATPGLDLVAVASTDPAKVHAAWPRLEVCNTPEALIACPDIDLIVLATPFESHFDRYRPEVRVRWRESGVPGSGLWYDLGSHLLDQVLQLFGVPQTIALDLSRQRDHAAADDWFHAVLRYDSLRVILHASALVLDLGPRFALHGTCGSFTKVMSLIELGMTSFAEGRVIRVGAIV